MIGPVQCLQYRDRVSSSARDTGVRDAFLEGVPSEHCPFPNLEGRQKRWAWVVGRERRQREMNESLPRRLGQEKVL